MIPITLAEAADRVAAIWFGRHVVSIRRYTDNTFEVQLEPAHRAGGSVLASDTRDRHLVMHKLDASGRAICHDDCRRLDQ